MSQAETTTYWNQIQAPGSPRLAQVLLQSGRLNQGQLAELRRRFNEQSQRRPVTLPVGDATSSQEVTVEQAWNEALDRDRILAEVLLHRNLVRTEHLHECRGIQRDQQLRLGVVIVKKGYASRSQIESAIAEVRRIGNGRLPWAPMFFESPSGRQAPQPASGRHVPPSARHGMAPEPPLVNTPRDSGRVPDFPPQEPTSPHGSQRLARDAAAASGSGRHEPGWPGAPPPSSLARTLEDEDPFASVRNPPMPGPDPLVVPLEASDMPPRHDGLGLPPVVSPQEDGMPTVIHRAAKPHANLPPGLAPQDFDDATILGGNSLDELNPFANFPLQQPMGDSAAITIETPEAPEPPVSGWGGSDAQQAGGWSSDMDILPSHSESNLNDNANGGFAPLPLGQSSGIGGGSGLGDGFKEDFGSGSDGFKISAQGGGDLPLSESGPAHPVPGFGPPSGQGGIGIPPIEGGEHTHAPKALVAASAGSRERTKARRLDKNTKLLRMLIGLCVGIFVISLALMAYILLFSEQPPANPAGGGQEEEAPETPGAGDGEQAPDGPVAPPR